MLIRPGQERVGAVPCKAGPLRPWGRAHLRQARGRGRIQGPLPTPHGAVGSAEFTAGLTLETCSLRQMPRKEPASEKESEQSVCKPWPSCQTQRRARSGRISGGEITRRAPFLENSPDLGSLWEEEGSACLLRRCPSGSEACPEAWPHCPTAPLPQGQLCWGSDHCTCPETHEAAHSTLWCS